MSSFSPRERFTMTPCPTTTRSLSTPVSRVSPSSLSDEAIWKRLHEAGFDEESIKRRDKSALIAYISKLEAEILDHQYHMGLLIMEKKQWSSKYEQLKASAESAESQYNRDLAAKMSALSKAKNQEDNLKKALEIEKECLKNIEKTMHEMRAEFAETKIAAEFKMAEARAMMEEANKIFTEAETNLRTAKSLEEEATRKNQDAEQKMQEVEAHEDSLQSRITSFKSECISKENEISQERLALSEMQRILQEGQKRLLEGQALLNQREEHMSSKSQDLRTSKKELDASKAEIDNQRAALNEEKADLARRLSSLTTKEEDVIKKEIELNKSEQELLVRKEEFASNEIAELSRLKDEHESILKRRMLELEAELEMKRKMVEDEIEAKRRAWELREVDFGSREELILEKERDSKAKSRLLAEKEADITEKLKLLEEKEKNINDAEKEVESTRISLRKDQEEINRVKLDLEKSLNSLNDKSKRVDCAKENVDAMKSETHDLLVLETKLKEEIDMVRAEKMELMARADALTVEKAKFEAEWESIDEKREELQKESERIANERLAITTLLKDERHSLKLERDAMREKYNQEVDALRVEREEFMSKMVQERSFWFSKTEQERADLLLDIEMQKRELEHRIDQRREELESDIKEMKQAFEEQKTKELESISSRKDTVDNDLNYVTSEMRRLETERVEIKVDRERRDREWAEINNSIEELKKQRQKLKRQRELLRADREDIQIQIEHLKKLQPVEMPQPVIEHSVKVNAGNGFHETTNTVKNTNGVDGHSLQRSASRSPSPAPLEWFKRCTDLIFKSSPEKSLSKNEDSAVISSNQMESLQFRRKLDPSNRYHVKTSKGNAKNRKVFTKKYPENRSGESKVIHEVPAEINTDVIENITGSASEQETLANRKRSVDSSAYDLVDAQLEEGQYTKKMRYEEGTIVDYAEDSITNCVITAQEIQVEAISVVECEGALEQTNVC